MALESELARTFVALADTLVAEFDIVELLQRLVEDSIRVLNVAQAGLLLADADGRLQLVASTSEQTRLLELFQLQADVGPCLEAFSTGRPVLVADLASVSDRWPEFATRAAEAGFRSVHAMPLRLRSETIGAMNLFHTSVGALTPDLLAIGQALADIATIGILQQRALARREVLNEQLQVALNSRVIIEQAKGVLAERGSVDMAESFNRLRAYARSHSQRLVDTARAVVEGSIDPDALVPRGRSRH